MSSFDGVKLRYIEMGMSARRSQLGGQMVPLNWFWTFGQKGEVSCNTIFFSTCQKVGSLGQVFLSTDSEFFSLS